MSPLDLRTAASTEPEPAASTELPVFGAGDFLAKAYPDPVALIDGLLSDDGGGWLGGEEKTGKTWWALDEALSLALGVPVAGYFAVPRPRRVMLFEEEDSPRRTQRRLRALLRGKGERYDPDDPAIRATLNESMRVCVWAGVTLDDPRMVAELRAQVEEFKPDVVYLDCLRKLSLRDLNKATEAGALLAILDGLRREFNVIFRVIHHYRKSQGFRTGRGSQEIGGSFVLGAWGENSLFFEPVGRKQGVVTIAVQSKDGAPLPGFRLRLEATGPAHNPDVVRLTVEPETTSSGLAATDEAVYQAIATLPTLPAREGRAGVPLDAVALAVNRTTRTAREAVKRLIDADRCSEVGTTSKNRKLYAVKANDNK
jgi:hypothetical protein